MFGRLIRFLKDWTLPVSMVGGALGYFICAGLPLSEETQQVSYVVISHYIQPMFLFSMLFLSFSKVDPRDLRPKRWHLWLIVIQATCIVVCSLLGLAAKEGVIPGIGYNYGVKILCEGAMLCFICPTATASSVITGKLGGSVSGVTCYLLLCNMMVALMAPALLPMVEPHEGFTFFSSFLMIMGKVFPLLICPLAAAWAVRFFLPELHKRILGYTDLAFYIWAVSLALAIAVTVRAIVHTTVPVGYILGLSLVSLVCCVFQFVVGKRLGTHYDVVPSRVNRITVGQAFGQKNTVFIIWLGLVFLDPVTSVVGGLYSVWHNTVNSYQLYKKTPPQPSP